MPTAQCLNCLHSFAFPGDLPPCPVFLMRFPLRSGWRKGSMWITAVFTCAYHAKAWSPLWCGGCRELQAMHKGGVWVLTALIERQKSPSALPSRDPDHLLYLLHAAQQGTQSWLRSAREPDPPSSWKERDNLNKVIIHGMATASRWEGLGLPAEPAWAHPQQGKGLVSLCLPFFVYALRTKLLSWSLPERLLWQLLNLSEYLSCHLAPSFPLNWRGLSTLHM